MLRRLLLAPLALLVVLTAGASPAAASGFDVLYDCGDDGALSRVYSVADYRQALDEIPADGDEYTDCRDVIQRALLARAGHGADGGGPAGGGAGPAASGGAPAPDGRLGQASADPLDGATSGERARVQDAVAKAAPPGAAVLTPGGPRLTAAAERQGLPAPLPATLLALGVALAAAGGVAAARRVHR